MANNVDKSNARLMNLTFENATFLNYITGYLQAYARAGMELDNMFKTYMETEMPAAQEQLVKELYANFQSIISEMRQQYLPK